MTEDFTNSKAGKKLLSFDIPKLIESLNRLSDAINASNRLQEKRIIFEQRKALNESKSNAGTTRSRNYSIESEDKN